MSQSRSQGHMGVNTSRPHRGTALSLWWQRAGTGFCPTPVTRPLPLPATPAHHCHATQRRDQNSKMLRASACHVGSISSQLQVNINTARKACVNHQTSILERIFCCLVAPRRRLPNVPRPSDGNPVPL